MSKKDGLLKTEVSVLMAINKIDSYLFPAINSILEQDGVALELILILNGPSVHELRLEITKRFNLDNIIIVETNIQQLSYALNLGIGFCSSCYIARMDSDDISDRLRLRKQLDFMIANDLDLLGSDILLMNADGVVSGVRHYPRMHKIKKTIYFSNTFCHPSVLMKKELLVLARGYNSGFASEDYDLWLRLARLGDIKWDNYPEPLLKYRLHDGSSQKSSLAYAECIALSVREFFLDMSMLKLSAFFFHVIKFFLRIKR